MLMMQTIVMVMMMMTVMVMRMIVMTMMLMIDGAPPLQRDGRHVRGAWPPAGRRRGEWTALLTGERELGEKRIQKKTRVSECV
jgi:hypothetical protein